MPDADVPGLEPGAWSPEPASIELSHDADVRESAGQRRHTDVAVRTYVHLPTFAKPFDAREVRPEGPAFRRRHEARETESECQPGMSALSSYNDAGGQE